MGGHRAEPAGDRQPGDQLVGGEVDGVQHPEGGAAGLGRLGHGQHPAEPLGARRRVAHHRRRALAAPRLGGGGDLRSHQGVALVEPLGLPGGPAAQVGEALGDADRTPARSHSAQQGRGRARLGAEHGCPRRRRSSTTSGAAAADGRGRGGPPPGSSGVHSGTTSVGATRRSPRVTAAGSPGAPPPPRRAPPTPYGSAPTSAGRPCGRPPAPRGPGAPAAAASPGRRC